MATNQTLLADPSIRGLLRRDGAAREYKEKKAALFKHFFTEWGRNGFKFFISSKAVRKASKKRRSAEAALDDFMANFPSEESEAPVIADEDLAILQEMDII